MPRLVAYFRVSTQRQGQSGLGLEAQQAAVQAYATQSGSTIVGSFVEVESGKRADRPELAKALARAKAVNAVLVIAKLDRLARNVAFVANLLESGVEFIACDSPHASRLTVHIMSAVAEDEARRISERTRAALGAAKARGQQLGGVRPGQHAFTDDDRRKAQAIGAATKSRAVRERDADQVVEAERLQAEGWSLARIAAHLNEAGHRSKQGKPLTATHVFRMLKRAEG